MQIDPGRFQEWVRQLPDHVVSDFIAELLILALGALVGALLPIKRWHRVARAFRYLWLALRHVFNRAGVVLLYADLFDEAVTKRLGDALNGSAKTSPYDVTVLNDSEGFLKWPLSSRSIHAVIVLITDVTKLGSSVEEIDQVQNQLMAFCNAGGILILGHDALYRRAGNAKLQQLAGSTIADYRRLTASLNYTKSTAGNAASGEWFNALPGTLTLDDGELLMSKDWPNDVKWVYQVANDGQTAPTVVMRRREKGVLFWINSGDKSNNETPKSIVTPEESFVTLLNALIHYRT
jgi:hypothetical protein